MIALLLLLQEWEIAVGAKSGEGPESVVEDIDGGVRLRGDADTRVWRVAKRAVEAPPGAVLRLDFEMRSEGLAREKGQFGDAFVGLAFYDRDRRRLALAHRAIHGPRWAADFLVARVPDRAASAEILVFLSMTGTFEARHLRLEVVPPERSFQLLIDDLAAHYAHFEVRKVDAPVLAERYRKRAEAAASVEEFAAVVKEMLGELDDPHVWIQLPGGPRQETHRTKPVANVDYRRLAKALNGVKQIGKVGFVGRTEDGIGYAALGTLQEDVAAFEDALETLFDAPAIVLDLRANHGGDEMRGRRIAAMFADRPRVYAKHRFRLGEGFTEPAERILVPKEGARYTKPVVVLTGPVCVSSGEALVLMMKALPQVTLVGRPTRGASGNPAPVELPNGVTVWHSRWLASLPDGTLFETRGIAPEVDVAPVDGQDPAFEKALEILRAKK